MPKRPEKHLKRWEIYRKQSEQKWELLRTCNTTIELQEALKLERSIINGHKRVKLRVDEVHITRRTILER